jgi:hypothetical protein
MIGFMKLKALVAITALTMALSAAAAYAAVDSVTGGSYGGSVQTDSAAQTNMLAVQNGDTINIAVTGVSSNSDVTLLSYKVGDTIDSTTIQYVDQYAVTGNSLDISFKVRDLDVGVYKLVVNDGTTGSAKTYYYKVGYPGLVDENGATVKTYFLGYNVAGGDADGDTVSVAYRAKMTGGSVKDFGFDITGAKNYTFTTEFAEGADVNVSGDYTFDMTIFGIPTTELETLNSLTVTPFVNFN